MKPHKHRLQYRDGFLYLIRVQSFNNGPSYFSNTIPLDHTSKSTASPTLHVTVRILKILIDNTKLLWHLTIYHVTTLSGTSNRPSPGKHTID